MAKGKAPHRGRFQAQGGRGAGLQESEHWAQELPLSATSGHALLTKLHDKLSVADQQLRHEGFEKAHAFINDALTAGGVSPMKKSFPSDKLRRADPRVDIEVNAGLAFVPEPAQ